MRHHKLMTHRADGRGRRRLRRPNVEALEQRSLLATITVTGTGDTIAKDGVVTLREAITAANTNADPSGDTTPGDPGPDTIAFNIPGTGVQTIQPHVRPAHDHRPGRHRRLHPAGLEPQHPGRRRQRRPVDRAESRQPAINGLTITAGDSTVRGLVINRNAPATGSVIESDDRRQPGSRATSSAPTPRAPPTWAPGLTWIILDARRQHDRRHDARGAQRHLGLHSIAIRAAMAPAGNLVGSSAPCGGDPHRRATDHPWPDNTIGGTPWRAE